MTTIEVQRDTGRIEDAYRVFLTDYPEYEQTASLDDLRRDEFPRLDRDGHVYLDYTGGGLYSDGQIRSHADFLLTNVLGNPHSTNPTSLATTERVERCRRRILNYFNADPHEYEVIFTANASQALKLVGESYPFSPGDRFLLTFDNHNSVNGIREFDRAHGADTRYVPVVPPDMLVDEKALTELLERGCRGGHKLFAFPAQSNFSGVQHPLEWIAKAQELGWDVLLDAAAFVPTNRLDLGNWKPDYVALSFYKMFGFPTGVGALIAKRRALGKLHRPWFAGGTIEVASVQADLHYMTTGAAAFEDGTLDYSNIPAVERGLDFIETVGLEKISTRVRCLSGWLIDQLLVLRHGNGAPLVRIYGPTSTDRRGGTVALNLYDRQGRIINQDLIEERANRQMISLRTGCFCNPGAGEVALGLSEEEISSCFTSTGDRMSYDEFRSCIDGNGAGAVRVSFGLASNFRDAHTFAEFAQGFLV